MQETGANANQARRKPTRQQPSAAELAARTAPPPLRHEAKYWLPPQDLPGLRLALRDRCVLDPNCQTAAGDYEALTMQFDSPDLCLYRARNENALNRIKLRARRYVNNPQGPVTLEIKGRRGAFVCKERCRVPYHSLGPTQLNPFQLKLPQAQEQVVLQRFSQLLRDTAARPILCIRYRREAWASLVDNYVRITIDRQLLYHTCHGWQDWGEQARWRQMDLRLAQAPMAQALLLEIKTEPQVPQWILDLVCRLGLQRQAISKYCLAIDSEQRQRPRHWPWLG